jgi:GNAT superfamily N-acetyltransferase
MFMSFFVNNVVLWKKKAIFATDKMEGVDMLGVNSPREPITPEFSKIIRAVREEYRGNKVGPSIVEMIADRARLQTFAGCQFLTVEALATSGYNAVGGYQRCGFTADEVRKPYKDTLRMFRTLYANEEVFVGDE